MAYRVILYPGQLSRCSGVRLRALPSANRSIPSKRKTFSNPKRPRRPRAHPATCSMDTGGFKQTTHLHLSVGLKNAPPRAFMFM